MNVLVVDNLETLQLIISAYLKIAGFKPHATGNAKKAVLLCNNYKFGLVVIDYELPHTNVLQLLKSIKKNQENVSAIIMTSNPLSFKLPKNSVMLHKPFTLEAFKDAMTLLRIKKEVP